MKAKEWRSRASAPIELTLPSGMIVMARRPPLQVWIKAGKLPDTLVQASLEARGSELEAKRMSATQLKEMFIFMREVIVYSVVEPRITEDVQNPDEEISPDEIPMEDGNFIFEWAMKGGQKPASTPSRLSESEAQQVLDMTDLQHFRSF